MSTTEIFLFSFSCRYVIMIDFLFPLSKLQLLLLIVSIAFVIFSLKTYRNKRIWFLTFCFLFFGSLTIGVFSLKIERLNAIGITFGLNRGADLIVYISIMVLFYFVIRLYSKSIINSQKQTQLIRTLSLDRAVGQLGSGKIAFVIPAYNESDHALEVFKQVLDAGHSIVFVDDGSQNILFQKAKLQFADQDFVAVQHLNNLWQWAALQTGFDYILSHPWAVEYIVTFDSDGQHCLEDLPHFLSAFKKNPNLEIVLWSRFLGKTINMPTSKKIVLKLWILFTSFFSGLKLSDTHNGYRVIKFSSLSKIKITMNGMEHASEILDIISEKKLHYAEVPNTIVYTEYSMARGQKLSNSIKIVKNLIFNKFFG